MLATMSGIIAICRFLMNRKCLISANLAFCSQICNNHQEFNKTLTISVSVSRSLLASIRRKRDSWLTVRCEHHIRALAFVHPVHGDVFQADHEKRVPFVLYALRLVRRFVRLLQAGRKEGVLLLIMHPGHACRLFRLR